jgi:hypothetical protein
MTEVEWLTCTDPKKMLEFLRSKASDRKLRLFACACCHRIWDRIQDERSRAAVEFADRFAETGMARRRGRPAIVSGAKAACRALEKSTNGCANGAQYAFAMMQMTAACAARGVTDKDAWRSAHYALEFAAYAAAWIALTPSNPNEFAFWSPVAPHPEYERQSHLLRCVFGTPFRSVVLDSNWLTWQGDTVTNLAQAIYDERRFADLPILADALEEAGCDNADILTHCRTPAEHVRGCWVVDALLGKT